MTAVMTKMPRRRSRVGALRLPGLAGNVVWLPDNQAVSLSQNLLTANQSTLETSTAGWQADTNATIARDVTQFRSGVASLSVTSVAAGAAVAGTVGGNLGFAVVPGQVVSGGIWARAGATSQTIRPVIDWFDAAGAFVSSSIGTDTTDVTTGWTWCPITATVPASIAFGRLIGRVQNTAAAAEVHYFDDAFVNVGVDLDLRVRVALDRWKPMAHRAQALVGKWDAVGLGAFSYYFLVSGFLGAEGRLSIGLARPPGDAPNTAFVNSSVVNPFNDGSTHWVRVTWRASDGRVQFLYDPDPSGTWQQLGTDLTQAWASIYDGPAAVLLGGSGAAPSGGSERLQGYLYEAEIRTGIDGPIRARFDASKVTPTADQVPATVPVIPDNLFTANQANVETDATGFGVTSGSVARVTTDSYDGAASLQYTTGGGGNPSMFVANESTGGQFPAVPGQRWVFVARMKQGSAPLSYQMKLAWYRADHVFISQTNPGYASDGTWRYISTSGIAPPLTAYVVPIMTVSGTPGAGVTTLFDTLGLYQGEIPPTGLSTWVPPDDWTINGNDWRWARQGLTPYRNAVIVNPALTTGISTPDSAPLSATTELDLIVKLRATDWTPASGQQGLVHKSGSYYFHFSGASLALGITDGGGTGFAFASQTLTEYADGSEHWARVTWRGVDGRVQFFKSDDGVAWTQKGADQSIVKAAINDTANPVFLGSNFGTSLFLDGALMYAEIRNAIDGVAVGVFDPNAAKVTGPQTPTTILGRTGETWTLSGAGWAWDAPVSAAA